ncbi:MAG TPA: APC family permease [Blastocatellia bacterium]|nr:APC family permease [Blastocatellia bacterium]
MTRSDQAGPAVAISTVEQRVQARSAVFKKELGLRDLVFAQILLVVGTGWVGTAAKLGASNIIFWLLGITLFYAPLAAVVIHLNRLMPLEGGLYQWAKSAFNEFTGFIVAWNTWLFIIVFMSVLGLSVSAGLAYAIGPSGGWMAESKWFITAVSFAVIAALALLSTLGFGVGKWVHNAGSIILLVTFATLIALPILSPGRDTIAELKVEMPELSLLNLTIFTKMAVYALAGFECMAIFAGECHNARRTISRSVMIAAPIIALMYILGTAAVLAFVRPDDVDLVNPIAQAFSIGFRPFGVAAYIAPVAILLLIARDIAQSSNVFAANTRLPMVAAWDKLLPEWFTRLHSKYKTPVNSIIFAATVTLTIGLAGLTGVGQQEAFQLLQSAAGVFFATTYLIMFSIPIIGLRNSDARLPLWLKIASASGFLVTLLFVALSIFPIVEVESRFIFAAKIALLIIAANAIGASIFVVARRKRSAHQATAHT